MIGSEMNFSRCKSEHVADYLRTAIGRGELAEPLPSLREWSSRLEVSSGTLQAALKILKREGWIASRPRKGLYLSRKPAKRPQHPPVVRWIWHDPKHRAIPPSADYLMAVSQRLAACHIGFQLDWCNDSRIQAIYKAGAHAHEMLVFPNLSFLHQRLFADFRNALIIGIPFHGIPLPYISSDVFPAIRHATFLALRHGCERVDLVNAIGRRIPESCQRLEDEFQKICAEAPRPIQGKVVWLPDEISEQCLAIQKVATRIRGRQGLIVNAPVSPGLLIMVLTNQGLKIPEQVEILPVNCTPGQMVVFPRLAHYPFPLEPFSKTVCKASMHYFETGALPELRKNLPLSMVSP